MVILLRVPFVCGLQDDFVFGSRLNMKQPQIRARNMDQPLCVLAGVPCLSGRGHHGRHPGPPSCMGLTDGHVMATFRSSRAVGSQVRQE